MLPEGLPLDRILAFPSRVLRLCACSVGNDRTSSLFHIFILETRMLIAYSSPSPCRPPLSPSSCHLSPCCPLPSFFRPSPWSCRPSPSPGCPRRQRRATPCQHRAVCRRRRAVALVVPSVVVPSVTVPPVALVVPPVAQQSAACSLADSKRHTFAGAPAAGCHGLCRFVCNLLIEEDFTV